MKRNEEEEKKLSQANKELALVLFLIGLAGFYQLWNCPRMRSEDLVPDFTELVREKETRLVRIERALTANKLDKRCPKTDISGIDQVVISSDRCQLIRGGASNFARLLAGKKMLINRAQLEELKLISGIGNKRAEMVLELREKRGRFYSLEELREFRWINDKMMDEFKRYFAIEDN